MKIEKIELSEAECFSSFFLDYMEGNSDLEDFYGAKPEIDSFRGQMKGRNFPESGRKVLVEVLEEQYKNIDRSAKLNENIQLLRQDNCFTVTTGHQLNIFTGPLYFIYKIITVINACRELSEQYPDSRFVPVYWMASEDHDFEEISHFRYAGQKYQWKTGQQGAVGRFNPGELKELIDKFPGIPDVFSKAYLEHDTLADSVRYYVNGLMGEYGVVVLDPDNAQLKSQFREVMKADIFEGIPANRVNESTEQLSMKGYKAQVHAREINFFYLERGLRTRIERRDNMYTLVDDNRVFSQEEMAQMIDSEPARFSPNVILRPLYQETILPNLAYIGGPSELVYWLQLKSVFEHFQVPFPVLMPRNFALVIPAHLRRKWDKTEFAIGDLFKGESWLARELTIRHTEKDLLLDKKSGSILKAFAEIRQQADNVDSSLGPMVEAETARLVRSLQKIEKKMIRAEKRKMSDRIRQVSDVKNQLFPGAGLQERKDNFLNFYLSDPGFIESLYQSIDAFDFRFHILSYEQG